MHPDQHLASHLLKARRNKHQQSQWYVISTSREKLDTVPKLNTSCDCLTNNVHCNDTAGMTSPALHRGHLRSYQPECPDNSFQSNSLNLHTGSRATWSTRTRTSAQLDPNIDFTLKAMIDIAGHIDSCNIRYGLYPNAIFIS